MDLGLKGKSVVITGASKGLGFATASTLLDEGARVVINSRSFDNLKMAKKKLDALDDGNNLFIDGGDVTSEAYCRELIERSAKILGGIDILITNTGGPPAGVFEDLSIGQWDDAIKLTFRSHLLLIRESIPYLKKSKSPSVLAIASFSVKNPLKNLILSNTIRASTVALIKSLSMELGGEGIRFNSILPGWTVTDRVSSLLNIRAEKNGSTAEEEMEKISAAIPLGRMADAQEFARPAAFLVSPAASYINGVALTVDGGITSSLL